MRSRGWRTSDPQRNAMGQSTEMSPLVSMLFLDISKSLEILNENFNILVILACEVSPTHDTLLPAVYYV